MIDGGVGSHHHILWRQDFHPSSGEIPRGEGCLRFRNPVAQGSAVNKQAVLAVRTVPHRIGRACLTGEVDQWL